MRHCINLLHLLILKSFGFQGFLNLVEDGKVTRGCVLQVQGSYMCGMWCLAKRCCTSLAKCTSGVVLINFPFFRMPFLGPFYVLVLPNKNSGLRFALEGGFMVHDTFRTQSGYFSISPHKGENEWCQSVTPFCIGNEIENFVCVWIKQCFVEDIFISQAYSLSLCIQ